MKKLLIFIILFCQPTFTAIAADTPRVVVSIKPLHSLVSGVMAGVGTPELVVQKGSPHGYSLRPSEAKALARADLIIWVGHELEGFLAKPLQNLAKDAQQLELADLLKTKLLTKRQSGNWEKPAHHHGTEEEGHEAHSEHQQAPDLHLWLDPHLAGEIVIETAEALVRIDPDHAREYRDNKLKMLARLAELDVELKDQLAPVKHYPYLVFMLPTSTSRELITLMPSDLSRSIPTENLVPNESVTSGLNCNS